VVVWQILEAVRYRGGAFFSGDTPILALLDPEQTQRPVSWRMWVCWSFFHSIDGCLILYERKRASGVEQKVWWLRVEESPAGDGN
jgi:hypothetical protein